MAVAPMSAEWRLGRSQTVLSQSLPVAARGRANSHGRRRSLGGRARQVRDAHGQRPSFCSAVPNAPDAAAMSTARRATRLVGWRRTSSVAGLAQADRRRATDDRTREEKEQE